MISLTQTLLKITQNDFNLTGTNKDLKNIFPNFEDILFTQTPKAEKKEYQLILIGQYLEK